ncbi:hypothetical protein ONE63_004934 [Megalurothrips usitatus]|uniref:Uncharacterized protein n=1 Tax=Megalurothrips usitatus TaxID=439358 RepID=A0AAV7X5J7_9NEOP|nr:hypothetical protein ONE63_004934 [Megalurothrips usitatus]
MPWPRAGLALAAALVAGLVSAAAARLSAPALTPPGQDALAVDLAVDFVATYLQGGPTLTVIGTAPWLGAFLRRLAASPTACRSVVLWPPPSPSAADVDRMVGMTGSRELEDVFTARTSLFGWHAAHALLLLDKVSLGLLYVAVSQLSPRAQHNATLVVCFVDQPPLAVLEQALPPVFGVARATGRFETVVLALEDAVGGLVLSFRPYALGCGNTTAVRLAAWTADAGFQPRAEPLFEEPRRYNLHGCTLRTAFFMAPPMVVYRRSRGNESARLEGFTGRILEAMAAVANTTFKLHAGRPTNRVGYYKGVLLPFQLLETVMGKADVTVGPVTSVQRRFIVLEWSNSPITECYVWLVPSELASMAHASMWDVVASFTWRLWTLLGVVVAGTVAAVLAVGGRLVGRQRRPAGAAAGAGGVASAVLAVLVGQPSLGCLRRGLPRGLPGRGRLLYGSWMLTGLVVCAAYNAKLLSIMSRSHRADAVTLEDVAAANLAVVVPRFIAGDLLETSRYKNGPLRVLVERSGTSTDMSPEQLAVAVRSSEYTMLLDERMATYLGAFTRMDGEANPPMIRWPKHPTCFVTYQSNYFAVARGSPLLARLDSLWKRLQQSGIALHLAKPDPSRQQLLQTDRSA